MNECITIIEGRWMEMCRHGLGIGHLSDRFDDLEFKFKAPTSKGLIQKVFVTAPIQQGMVAG